MPPKKNKSKGRNEFYYFMQDQKQVFAQQNVQWDTMEDLVALCHPLWQKLSGQEKAKYRELSKKSRDEETRQKIYQVEEENKEQQKAHEDMLKDIIKTLNEANDKSGLNKQSFCLIHVNKLLVIEDDDKCLPCEMAVLKFNLQAGIVSAFHTFVAPPQDEIPLGYSYEIQRIADDTHGLTMDEDPILQDKSSRHQEIALKILHNIEENGEKLPVFTLAEEKQNVDRALHALFSWAGMSSAQIRIYDLHQLLFQMTQFLPKTHGKLSSDLLAAEWIASDTYSYIVGIGCPYHDRIDKTRYCSLNCVKGWAYLIMEQCCPGLKIKQEPNSHYHQDHLLELPYKQDFFVPFDFEEGFDPTINAVVKHGNLFTETDMKSRPAGFVPLEESFSNPKKMNPLERAALEKKLAAQGRTLEDYFNVTVKLQEPKCPWDSSPAQSEEPKCPWDNPVALVPEPACPWDAPKPNPNWGVRKETAPVKSPWGKPANTEPVKSPWGKPAKSETVFQTPSDYPSLGEDMKFKKK